MLYYSEPWIAYHTGLLTHLGLDNQALQKLSGLPSIQFTECDYRRLYPVQTGHALLHTLYDQGYYRRDELLFLDKISYRLDKQSASLLNCADITMFFNKLSQLANIFSTGIYFQLKREAGRVFIYLQLDPVHPAQMTLQGILFFIGLMLNKQLAEPLGPDQLEIAVPRGCLPGADTICERLTARLRQDQSEAYLAIDEQALQHLGRFYNPLLEPYLQEDHARMLQQPRQLYDALLESVKSQLDLSCLGNDDKLSIQQVAAQLNMSRSTLYRHLAERNLTFKQLLENKRKDEALHQLSHSDLSIGEISDRLGYANLSAFNRAFKRWFNTTPGTFRRH